MGQRSTWVGWGLLALGLVGNAAGVVLSVVNDRFLQDSGEDVVLTLAFGSFLVVGCVLVARRPDNRIGWIFTAVGLLTTAAILAEGYATFAYVTHPGVAARPAGRGLGVHLDLAPDRDAHGGVPAVVVPDRPVAVVPLAARDLAGGWRDRGLGGSGWAHPGVDGVR
jgi:hypothetical protein